MRTYHRPAGKIVREQAVVFRNPTHPKAGTEHPYCEALHFEANFLWCFLLHEGSIVSQVTH